MDDVLGYDGASVVVTGAASGMGAAAAQILVDLGARVTALDIKPTTVPVTRSLEVDLRDRAAIEAAAAEVDGPVDGLSSCAGLPGPPFSELDTMTVNFVMLGSPRLSYVAGEAFNVDGGFQGARYTGRHQAGWADLINQGPEGDR